MEPRRHTTNRLPTDLSDRPNITQDLAEYGDREVLLVFGFNFGHEWKLVGIRKPVRSSRTLTLRRVWREILEHFGNAFVQVLFILLWFARDGIFRRATPYQLLRFCA